MPITTRITQTFDCRHPIQQAGMGGVTSPALALAVAAAGGIGMLSGTAGARSVSTQLDAVPAGAAVGVSFLVPYLDRAALEEAAARSPLVELFWGTPSTELVQAVHEGGARAGWQVGSADEARRAAAAGCDVIVAQGIEAGGHVRGTRPLLLLLEEVVRAVEVPVIAAGGIGRGADVAAGLAAGADGVRIGTRFLAAVESPAHPDYVAALIGAGPDDTIVTTAFGDGWPDAPHRVLRAAVEAGRRRGDAQAWSPMWPTEDSTGAVDAMALYAGRSVGSVQERLPVAAIVEELIEEAERLLAAR